MDPHAYGRFIHVATSVGTGTAFFFGTVWVSIMRISHVKKCPKVTLRLPSGFIYHVKTFMPEYQYALERLLIQIISQVHKDSLTLRFPF